MSEISFDDLYQALLESVPELRRDIEAEFGSDYDLSLETPGAYLIFEDVVRKFLLDRLSSSENAEALRRLFGLFEKLANSNDRNVTDLLRIAILEPLVCSSDSLELARHYMGSKTAAMASQEEQQWQQVLQRRRRTDL